jgi:hypothetical protein
MMPAMREIRPFQLRLPADVKAWLTHQARLNGSSQNSEVIRAIRLAMTNGALKESVEGKPQ